MVDTCHVKSVGPAGPHQNNDNGVYVAHSWDKCVLHGREGSGREDGAKDMGKLSLPHSFVAIWNLQ